MKTFDLEEAEAIIEARRRRERWYRPGVWMLRSLHHKLKDGRNEVRWAYQRVTNGWDVRALWSLDDHLSKSLGEQLVAMAKNSHGHPCDKDPDEWTTEIRAAGEALLAYQKSHYDVYGDDFEAIYKPAQEALVWVSENLASLWD